MLSFTWVLSRYHSALSSVIIIIILFSYFYLSSSSSSSPSPRSSSWKLKLFRGTGLWTTQSRPSLCLGTQPRTRGTTTTSRPYSRATFHPTEEISSTRYPPEDSPMAGYRPTTSVRGSMTTMWSVYMSSHHSVQWKDPCNYCQNLEFPCKL